MSIETELLAIGFALAVAASLLAMIYVRLFLIHKSLGPPAADLHFLRDLTEHNGTVPCPTCNGSGIDPRAALGRKVNCLACGGSKRVTP